MKRYLDIPSLIKSNYYSYNNRLNWHLDHSEYDIFSKNIYDLLNNLLFEGEEHEILQIVKFSLHHNLCSYLSHLYDFFVLSKKNINAVYSENSNIYIKKIWQHKPLSHVFQINLERKRFQRSVYKSLYSSVVQYIPKGIFHHLIISKNQLISDFTLSKRSKSLQIIPAYYYPINLSSNNFIRKLSRKISDKIVFFIESNYFVLSKEHQQSVFFIIESYLARANNDLNSTNEILKNYRIIISSSGTNYYNRLISTIAKKQGSEIWRFHHGGERCFFNEPHYWNEELFNADLFISFGKKWSDFGSEIIKDKKLVTKTRSLGSIYHKKISDIHFSKNNKSKVNILYIPNSFVGEARQFPFIKIIDPLLFDWQKYLIELLQNNGFDVIYKKHPKGFFQAENILGKIAKYESTKPMIEALHEADIVLCDMAGSAFVEALCAGKKVILIDTKQRPFHEKNKVFLSKFVTIVDAYWEDNILKINEENLIDSLNYLSLDRGKYMEFLNDYYLEGCN